MQQRSDLLDAKLAVRRLNREQFAAGEFLGRAALIDIDVRSLRTNHCLVRVDNRLQPENVSARAAKDEIDRNVSPEMLLEQLCRPLSERIVAISDDVSVVRSLDSFDDLRMHSGVVVAGEAAFAHTLPALKSRAISRAAFAPGLPVIPPPGCVPAPQR